MTPQSKYTEKGVFRMGSHHMANDGISENALNLALFLLCIAFLSLSMASTAWSLHETNGQMNASGVMFTETATEPGHDKHYTSSLNAHLAMTYKVGAIGAMLNN